MIFITTSSMEICISFVLSFFLSFFFLSFFVQKCNWITDQIWGWYEFEARNFLQVDACLYHCTVTFARWHICILWVHSSIYECVYHNYFSYTYHTYISYQIWCHISVVVFHHHVWNQKHSGFCIGCYSYRSNVIYIMSQKKRPPFYFWNNSVKKQLILMIFRTLNPEKISHENLTDLSTSPVRCSHFTLGNPKKLFSTVLFIHTSDY